MLYAASFFEPEYHNGQLFAISHSIPKSSTADEQLLFLAPSKSLLMDWKNHRLSVDDYTNRFRTQLDCASHTIESRVITSL